MKKKLILPAVLLVGSSAMVTVFAAPKSAAPAQVKADNEMRAWIKALDSPHTKWMAKSLKEIKAVKVGQTRAQLLKVFTTEGGISTRTSRRYVYRECPYIKVDVEFKIESASKKQAFFESGNDVITKISAPFLEWSIMD